MPNDFPWLPILFASDLGIALAYFIIPFHIHRLSKGPSPIFRASGFSILFRLFITLCGGTHVMAAWNIYQGQCAPHGWGGVFTVALASMAAIVSLFTAYKIPAITGVALQMLRREQEKLTKELETLEAQLHNTQVPPNLQDLLHRAVRAARAHI
jgi:hypothetical protein